MLFSLPAGFWPGLICGAIFLLLSSTPVLKGLERSTLDFQFRLRGVRYPSSQLVVIRVDNATVERGTASAERGWPIPRRMFAEAITRLQESGARTVALDVLFLDPSDSAQDDAQLATAINSFGNVVLASVLRTDGDPRLGTTDSRREAIAARLAVQNYGARPRSATSGSGPDPALINPSTGVGHITVFPEENGTLRRVPHLIGYRGMVFPSLSLVAVANYLGMAQSEIEAMPHGVRLGSKNAFPLEMSGDAVLNWVGGNTAHTTYSMSQLLDGKVPAQALRDKLILIGVTADGAYESRSTPFSSNQPALEFQANAIDNLLTNRPLREVPRWFVLVMALWFPLTCGIVMGHQRSWALLWLSGLGAAVWLGSIWSLQHDFYWPVGVTLLAGAVATGCAAAVGFRHQWDANMRADAAVAALARGTTLLGAALAAPAGGSRDRLHAVIRATARETLGAREVFVVLIDRHHDGEGFTPPEVLARLATERGHTLVWPNPPLAEAREGVLQRLRRVRQARKGEDSDLFAEVSKWLHRPIKGDSPLPDAGQAGAPTRRRFSRLARVQPTLVVAPFPPLSTADGETMPGRVEGALLAMDRRDGGVFSLRDAALLEALAKQAALALDNWEYGEALRGKVEVANKELSSAYRMLAEQSAKLFAAVESIEAAIVVSDQNGTAIFVNPAGGRVLRGATPILGEPVGRALASGDLDELAVLFDSMRLSGGSPEKTRVETKRGRELLSAQFTPLQGQSGQMLGAMLVVTDITAQRELDRMKTDFVGFVAHELRTPLTTILGYASLLDQSAGRLSVDQMHDMTTVITRHCRRMNRLINDLLDISRLEAGEPLPLQTTMFDVATLLDRLVEELRSQLNPSPRINLLVEVSSRPVEIMGDPDRIEQVLINLLSNAIKYSPEGGDIIIRLGFEREEMYFAVQDHGMGMTPEQVESLFSKFYRTPDARARGIKGTGLGLHLVKQIIESHGGQIQVHSIPGQGSTFRFTLPSGVRIR